MAVPPYVMSLDGSGVRKLRGIFDVFTISITAYAIVCFNNLSSDLYP